MPVRYPVVNYRSLSVAVMKLLRIKYRTSKTETITSLTPRQQRDGGKNGGKLNGSAREPAWMLELWRRL